MVVSVVLESRAFHHLETLFVPFWGSELAGVEHCPNTVLLDNFCPERVHSASASRGIRCQKESKFFVFKPRSPCDAAWSRHETCCIMWRGAKCIEPPVFSCGVPGGRKEFHASP
jgi:hypothetical protein